MNILKLLYTYLFSLAIFLGIDFVWLGFIAKNMYQEKIGHLMASSPKLLPAGVFYLTFVVGVLLFTVLPGLKEDSLIKTLLLAAAFGFFTYSTYDLTNLATLKDWPLIVTIIDIIWGMFIASVTALAGFLFNKYILK